MLDTVAQSMQHLSAQINGIFRYYLRLLDDEFAFAAAVQVPQVATIFDAAQGRHIDFAGERLTLTQLIALIAYRYGFMSVRKIGHGGYAVVLGHDPQTEETARIMFNRPLAELRRVLRLVPDHHVQNIIGDPVNPTRPFDVQLDANNEPIRDPEYPLLLSDLFLLPRHTTKIVLRDARGEIMMAGGRPAILHCQLLPEAIAMNDSRLDQQMAIQSGERLAAGLATLGVSVADAHGGNGGVLVSPVGKPILRIGRGTDGKMGRHYVPIVLDFGYYSRIGPRTLSEMLLAYGVTIEMMAGTLEQTLPHIAAPLLTVLYDETRPLSERFQHVINESGLRRATFGRLLYFVDPPIVYRNMWIDHTRVAWESIRDNNYPALRDQSRLRTMYPTYNEITFPQHIETYDLQLMG
jgi:hypothetical protein